MVCRVYSLESPRGGDSNEYAQYNIHDKLRKEKIPKISRNTSHLFFVVFLLLFFLSSSEQKLRVSYCDHPLSVSVVVRRLSSVGQVRYWVTWGQKLGHQVKSKEKLVDTLKVTF